MRLTTENATGWKGTTFGMHLRNVRLTKSQKAIIKEASVVCFTSPFGLIPAALDFHTLRTNSLKAVGHWEIGVHCALVVRVGLQRLWVVCANLTERTGQHSRKPRT